jgi:HK97 family phage major capsid protein
LIKHSYGVGEYYAAPAATRHQLEDASVDIAGWLIENATHDFAETEGGDFLTWDGSNNFARGLLTYGTTNEKDSSAPGASISMSPPPTPRRRLTPTSLLR